jgi:hypothetical protein
MYTSPLLREILFFNIFFDMLQFNGANDDSKKCDMIQEYMDRSCKDYDPG